MYFLLESFRYNQCTKICFYSFYFLLQDYVLCCTEKENSYGVLIWCTQPETMGEIGKARKDICHLKYKMPE